MSFNIQTLSGFNVVKLIGELCPEIRLWLCEGNDGAEVEILSIQRRSHKSLVERVLRSEIRPLIDKNISVLQKIIKIDYDIELDSDVIIYESCYDNLPLQNPTLTQAKQVCESLDSLKKENRYGYYISPETLSCNEKGEVILKYMGLWQIWKAHHLIDEKYLAPNVLQKNCPTMQDDLYSVALIWEQCWEKNALIEVYQKCVSNDISCRYVKYSEVIADIDKALLQHRKAAKIVIKQEDKLSFQPILTEMNERCYIEIRNERSREKRQIMGNFSTENWQGCFFVDAENHLFIPFTHCKNEKNNNTLKYGFCADFGFNFSPNGHTMDSLSFFQEKFDQKNQMARLNREKKESIKKWQTLPEKEKEYIEENAFKANYIKRQVSHNSLNIKFTLREDFRDWDKIRLLKKERVVLNIDEQLVGEILDYHPNESFLTIRDAKTNIDELPEKGELMQDIRQETSQFKKQIEACKNFETRNIANPELCAILTTPEKVGANKRWDIDYEGFIEQVFNKNLKTDETQRNAVLEALHKKPVYLIQGPPGTGKTTVIVELIRQIIKGNPHARILVTSQSNMAVDNVLEQLPESILFMRLASAQTIDKENIGEKMLPHLFERKLNLWAKETERKSQNYFYKLFPDAEKQQDLLSFYDAFCMFKAENSWKRFEIKLSKSGNYLKRLFEKASNFVEALHIFEDKLGKKCLLFYQQQKEWFAFLANISEERKEKQSKLNDGSTETDFLTAFAKSVNVIGATCIHIASSQYSKINFKFDYVIMDESSKASPAEALVPIGMAKNIIMIGDHKQLPPVVTREDAVKQKVKHQLEDNGLDFDKEFSESLFEKLIVAFEGNADLEEYSKMLNIQYRMPRQIGDIISRHFYEGKLQNPSLNIIPNFDKNKHHGLKLKKEQVMIKEGFVPSSVVFVSTSQYTSPYDNDNKFNRNNACNVAKIQEILAQLNTCYEGNSQKEKPFTVGIIAGYRGQVQLLQDKINMKAYPNFIKKIGEDKYENLIEINTVDKFQGAERDIIIYDIVKSSAGNSNIGFLDDYRRINVAFSRVKRLLIVVGDSQYLLKRATLNPSSQFQDFKLKSIVQELEQQGLIVHNFNEILG